MPHDVLVETLIYGGLAFGAFLVFVVCLFLSLQDFFSDF